MTAKQFLENIWNKDFEINILQEEIDDLKSKMISMHSPSYSSEKVQTSASDCRLDALLDRINEKEKYINLKIDEYVDYRENAVSMINMLPNKEEAYVLFQWYIKRKSPREIAMQIDRSTSTVWGKCRSALDSFEKMYSDVLND